MKVWWRDLSARERAWISIATLCLLVILLVNFIIHPFIAYQEKLRVEVKDKEVLLAWMQQQSPRLLELRQGTTKKSSFQGQSLLHVVEKHLQRESLQRYNPKLVSEQSNKLRLTFVKVPFNRLVTTLARLQGKYPLSIEQATFKAGDKAGFVKAELLIRR